MLEQDQELNQKFERLLEKNDPLKDFSKMICPQLSGHHLLKQAVLLMLTTQRDYSPNSSKRNRIHIGLVGEPGTGKTVLMQYLEKNWGAKYLTHDTTSASLKGDSRRKDMGCQIFSQNNGGIIAIDEIELMARKTRETLRDVMENGEYQQNKSGMSFKQEAQIRFIIGSNNFDILSDAIIDRCDFVFEFKTPDVEESKKISQKVLDIYCGKSWGKETKFLRGYLDWLSGFEPEILPEERPNIDRKFEEFFDHIGEGKTGRWISRAIRIGTAIAKLYKSNVKAKHIHNAIALMQKQTNSKEWRR